MSCCVHFDSASKQPEQEQQQQQQRRVTKLKRRKAYYRHKKDVSQVPSFFVSLFFFSFPILEISSVCFFSFLKHIIIIIGIRRRNNLPPFNAQWVKYRCVEGGRFGKLSKRKHKERKNVSTGSRFTNPYVYFTRGS